MKKKLEAKISDIIYMMMFILGTILMVNLMFAQDELEYDLSVKALQVPFVAADSKGRPVFDLKMEELELYIDGKPHEIQYLFDSPFKSVPAAIGGGPVQEIPYEMKRIKFIIIDTFFNSLTGIDKSKKIAQKLIENCSPRDMFVLLQITFSGLEYIAGPEPGGVEFLKYLDKVKKVRQSMELWIPSESEIVAAYSFPDWMGDPLLYLNGSKIAVDVSFNMYKDSFKQLNNALITINNPKVTYVLNEGIVQTKQYGTIADDGRKYNSAQVRTRWFENIVDEYVYDGGSILKKVDLNLVDEIKPSQLDEVAADLIRSTDAYYEIYFDPGDASAKDLKIEIKCKRPGVKINSVRYKDKDKPYMKLSEIRKKAYAVNAAFGQSSSRILGRIKKAPYIKLEQPGSGNTPGSGIEVTLPIEMQNRSLDVFLIYLNEQYKDPVVTFESKKFDEKARLEIKPDKKRKIVFFSIIEPVEVYTLVNRIE